MTAELLNQVDKPADRDADSTFQVNDRRSSCDPDNLTTAKVKECEFVGQVINHVEAEIKDASKGIESGASVSTNIQRSVVVAVTDLPDSIVMEAECEFERSPPTGPRAYYRDRGSRGGYSQNFRDRKMGHHNGVVSPGAAVSQYKMSLSEGEKEVYDNLSTILATFNEDMRAQVAELQKQEDERVQRIRLQSYVIHNNMSTRPAILHQMDLRTNKQYQVSAAEVVNSQAMKIHEQAEQIKCLQDRLNKSEQTELEHRAALGEFRIKNHIQETTIARLEASLMEHDRPCEQVQANRHSHECTSHLGILQQLRENSAGLKREDSGGSIRQSVDLPNTSA